MKDDQYIIGTGANENPQQYAKKFFDYVKEEYNLSGELVKREGFSSTLQEGVYLGEENMLLVGDAAGLVDLYRGLGMDNAALSGRLAVKAVLEAENKDCPAIIPYQRMMKKIASKIEAHAKKQKVRYTNNEILQQSLSPFTLVKGGLSMLAAVQLNKILPPEKMIMLPL